MRCPSCSRDNKPGARFCAFCGAMLEEEAGTLQTNQLVDHGTYRIIRPLGKGGMGAVYLAANTKAFDRMCIIKEVIEYYDPTDAAARQKAIERFEAEARTLAALKHHGIPDIYAYFTEQGRNYLVMEYIEGPNLAMGLTREQDGQIIPGQLMPVDRVVRYALQICEVLDYLEQRQPPVIHNDIKPANIILDKNSGRAVLVDFGTARTRYSRQAAGQPGAQHSSVYGTVGYAAPELYEGRAEPRSDVYALAATAYHLLTDDDPRAHPFDFPKMSTIPEPLRLVLQEALAIEADKRPTATQFAERLEEARHRMTVQPGSARAASPLSFPQGSQATTRQELISLSVKHWDHATGILYDGSLARWLRTALGDEAAAQAAESAVHLYARDANAGLDYFIRSLDSQAMPRPRLQVLTPSLRYGEVTARDASKTIRITNAGGGYLYGTATSSAPWVQVAEQIKCPPGQEQVLPVVVDVSDLAPGKTYTAKIDIRTSDGQSASTPLEVRVPLPVIQVAPTQIDLGRVSGKAKFSDIVSFTVRNVGAGRAHCQIEDIPPWLTIDPHAFSCPPGQSQEVTLRGQLFKLPSGTNRHSATLQVLVKGGRAQQVRVTLQTKAGSIWGTRIGAAVMIGFATLFLLAAIIWFVIQILPLLGL